MLLGVSLDVPCAARDLGGPNDRRTVWIPVGAAVGAVLRTGGPVRPVRRPADADHRGARPLGRHHHPRGGTDPAREPDRPWRLLGQPACEEASAALPRRLLTGFPRAFPGRVNCRPLRKTRISY